MVIPVGPPGAQHILKIVKKDADGDVTVTRTDIYNGRPINFVPFTKLQGDAHQGHAQPAVSLRAARSPLPTLRGERVRVRGGYDRRSKRSAPHPDPLPILK